LTLPKIDALTRNITNSYDLCFGISESIPDMSDEENRFAQMLKNKHQLSILLGIIIEASKINKTKDFWSVFSLPDLRPNDENLKKAIQHVSNPELSSLWSTLTGYSGGGRDHSWVPDTIRRIMPSVPAVDVYFIPAIRRVGEKELDNGDLYDGTGIIDKLAKLQNPDVHSRALRQKFEDITSFVCSVLDKENAKIEIPYDRDTILVHMDDKVLPLDSLGTGVHEVIILAAAATILTNTVVCIEEPELHLNPLLQRKLLRYLKEHTSNQYFITTHSPAIMDTEGAEIYHIFLENGHSRALRVTSDGHKSDICEDLGYHPSDLMQANCIIWVEGPSDRIYLKYWLEDLYPNLIEGIHFSIMFYGGRLLSHLSYEEHNKKLEDLVKLQTFNRRAVIIIDSDKPNAKAPINETKQRLCSEFNNGVGYAWLTDGREMENYLPEEQIRKAILATTPNAMILSNFKKYDNNLKIKGGRGKVTQASKVEVAHYITKNYEPNFYVFDLKDNLSKLAAFIKSSNPSVKY